MLTLPVRPFFLHNILSYSTILFLLFSLAKIFYNKDFHFKKNKNSIFLFTAIFIWWAVGILYSEDISQALRYLETKLGLFLIPFFILAIEPIKSSDFKKILKVYALGISGYLIICYILIIIQNYNYNQFESVIYPFFMYHSLVHNIGMHATYMSIQVALSIFIVLDIIISSGFKISGKFMLKQIWIVFLLFVLISLTVKMVILAFFASLLVYVVSKFGLIPSAKIILPFSAIVILLILFFSDDYWFKKRVGFNEKIEVEKLDMDPENQRGKWGSLNMRYALAKTSLEVIKDNLIFGVGIGDEKLERNKVFEKYDFQFALNRGFNEHNQYLNVLLSAGLTGLFILLLLLFLPIYMAGKLKDSLYLAFLVLVLISFFSENYLSRQTGIMFFAFFNSLFWQQLSMINKTIQSKTV